MHSMTSHHYFRYTCSQSDTKIQAIQGVFVVLNNQYDFVMCDGQTSDFLGVGDIL